jgi:hypothetical protein
MADRLLEMDQQTIAKYRHHQGLVEHLLRFLQTELNSHTFELDDHEAHEYHTRIDDLYTQIRQLDQLR